MTVSLLIRHARALLGGSDGAGLDPQKVPRTDWGRPDRRPAVVAAVQERA